MPGDTTASCGEKRKRNEDNLLPSEWYLHPFDAPCLVLVMFDNHTSANDIIVLIHGQDGSKFAVRVNQAWPTSIVLDGTYLMYFY